MLPNHQCMRLHHCLRLWLKFFNLVVKKIDECFPSNDIHIPKTQLKLSGFRFSHCIFISHSNVTFKSLPGVALKARILNMLLCWINSLTTCKHKYNNVLCVCVCVCGGGVIYVVGSRKLCRKKYVTNFLT